MSRGVVVVTAAGSGRAAMSASRATHPGNPMPPCQGQISQWLAPDLLHIPARVVHSEHWSRDLAAHVPSLRWHTTDAWLSSARALAASACTAVGEPRAWQHAAQSLKAQCQSRFPERTTLPLRYTYAIKMTSNQHDDVKFCCFHVQGDKRQPSFSSFISCTSYCSCPKSPD